MTGSPIPEHRDLTDEERTLARWLLEHGEPDTTPFVTQLGVAKVVARCPCGCASIDFEVEGRSPPSGHLRILSDYVYGDAETLTGIFIFERGGVLAGLEVYGLAGEAPSVLPNAQQLRPFRDGGVG
jgi:hypothetical protein